VCSPGFLDENPLSHPGDLARLPLLQLTTRPDAWDNWFRSNKIDPPQEQGMAFEQFSIIAQAAVAGLGVALLPKFLIQSELERKELVVILNMPTKSEDGYYLVTPADKSEHAPVTALREWLLNVVG
jgi:DNA-binding transcriptional LysR family regulator